MLEYIVSISQCKFGGGWNSMSNQYAKGTVQLLIRLDEEKKRQFYEAVDIVNSRSFGAPYSANAVMRGIIEIFIKDPDIIKKQTEQG